MNTTVHFVDNATTVRFPTSSLSLAQISALMRQYNDSLGFFNSNEDALAGIDEDGNSVTPLEVGDEYKSGSGNDTAPRGTKLVVI